MYVDASYLPSCGYLAGMLVGLESDLTSSWFVDSRQDDWQA